MICSLLMLFFLLRRQLKYIGGQFVVKESAFHVLNLWVPDRFSAYGPPIVIMTLRLFQWCQLSSSGNHWHINSEKVEWFLFKKNLPKMLEVNFSTQTDL